MNEAIDKKIVELLRLGFIEPSEGSAYASPTVVVQKRDSDQIRLRVNYKRLNAATVFDPEAAIGTRRVQENVACAATWRVTLKSEVPPYSLDNLYGNTVQRHSPGGSMRHAVFESILQCPPDSLQPI